MLILGAYRSEGRRNSGTIASFLLGVSAGEHSGGVRVPGDEDEEEMDMLSSLWANPSSRPKQGQPRQQLYFTFGRCGSGLTLEDIRELTQRVPFREWKPGMPLPHHFKAWKPARADVPDYWVDPAQSLLLEVKCAEIIESDSFSAGLACRWGR